MTEDQPTPPPAAPAEANGGEKKLSKNQLKKLEKQRKAAAAKAEKEAKRAAEKAAQGPSTKKANEEDLDPTAYFENRENMLNDMEKTKGISAFPHKFHVDKTIPDFVTEFEHVETGAHLEDTVVSVAGRLHSKRISGTKLHFYDLRADGAKIQVMSSINNYESPVGARSSKTFNHGIDHEHRKRMLIFTIFYVAVTWWVLQGFLENRKRVSFQFSHNGLFCCHRACICCPKLIMD